jgi:alcohol dehydrogenase class IV
MALASMTAGMAFANSGLGLVHGLVHPIGARFGVPHGMACGRLLPLVMRYNQPAAEEKMAQVGRALTRRPEAEAQDAADAVESLLRDLGVPAGIGDVGVPADQIPSLARDGLLAGAVRTNPRSVTEQEALALLQQAARA